MIGAVLVALTAGPSVGSTVQTPADRVLSRAREVLGGQERLNRVRNVEFSGAVVALDQTVPPAYRRMPYELRAAFPDRFVEIATGPAGPVATGVDGQHALYVPLVPPAMRGQPMPLPAGLVDDSRQMFAVWMLLTLLRTDTAWPLVVEPVVEDSGAYETIRFRRRGAGDVWLDVDRATSAPTRVRYRIPTAAGSEAEVALVAEDRRDVSGVRMPFRVRQLRNGQPFMNYREFDRVRVNVDFVADDFEGLRYRP